MKAQINTQTQPAKKLALSKQTLRVLQPPPQTTPHRGPTAECSNTH